MWDEHTQQILGFFVAKGFLHVAEIEPQTTLPLDIAEVLKVATEIEPRILEVLPAALLRFPGSFINWEAVPEKLTEILECLRKDEVRGPDLGGLPYRDLRRWVIHTLPEE